MPAPLSHDNGFTLIELSIVLVIIGLIVGGVLVGQSLIQAAGVRAQIAQIEQYNTAVNTFYGKFGYLPGDIPATTAVQFGLSASVAARSWSGVTYGDGDGVVMGLVAGETDGGETYLFWSDLAAAALIQESQVANINCNISVGFCNVPARLGQGNGIYVFSGGYNGGVGAWPSTGVNYFGISTALTYLGGGLDSSNPGLTVAQAYAIDAKMDDGLPQSGRVIAAYLNYSSNGYGSDYGGAPVWVNPGGLALGVYPLYGIPLTAATAGSSTTCYDNGNVAGVRQQYSMNQNGGAGVNCALSFQFQ